MPMKIKELRKKIERGKRNTMIETIEFLRTHHQAYGIIELNKHVGITEKGQSLGRKLRILRRILQTLGFPCPIKMQPLGGKTYVYWDDGTMGLESSSIISSAKARSTPSTPSPFEEPKKPKKKLDLEVIKQIKELREKGIRPKMIAKRLNVTPSQVSYWRFHTPKELRMDE